MSTRCSGRAALLRGPRAASGRISRRPARRCRARGSAATAAVVAVGGTRSELSSSLPAPTPHRCTAVSSRARPRRRGPRCRGLRRGRRPAHCRRRHDAPPALCAPHSSPGGDGIVRPGETATTAARIPKSAFPRPKMSVRRMPPLLSEIELSRGSRGSGQQPPTPAPSLRPGKAVATRDAGAGSFLTA